MQAGVECRALPPTIHLTLLYETPWLGHTKLIINISRWNNSWNSSRTYASENCALLFQFLYEGWFSSRRPGEDLGEISDSKNSGAPTFLPSTKPHEHFVLTHFAWPSLERPILDLTYVKVPLETVLGFACDESSGSEEPGFTAFSYSSFLPVCSVVRFLPPDFFQVFNELC